MPRPPTDATRFTSTGPSAASYPSYRQKSSSPAELTKAAAKSASTPASNASPTSRPLPSSRSAPSGPPGETPKQKVERLRAEHRRRRFLEESSPLERVIARGRVWADVAHRITVYSLMGFSVVASAVAVYSMGSLISHNRRQKRAWIERELQKLHDARVAFLDGTANPEQLHILEQEQAGEEMKRQREEEARIKKENSILTKLKRSVIPQDQSMGAEDDEKRLAEQGEDEVKSPLQILAELRVLRERKERELAEGQAPVEPSPQGPKQGVLDQLGENVATKASAPGDRAWMSWLKWKG